MMAVKSGEITPDLIEWLVADPEVGQKEVDNSFLISSDRSSNSHPDLLLIHHPLFQIKPVLNTGLSLSEPLQL